MHKKRFKGLDLYLYHEKLPSGLNVYLIPMPKKKSYFVNYYTKYGSIDLEFVNSVTKEKVITPSGTAHFLEHKMFEQEDGATPFEYFSRSGTDCNASTGNIMTKYIIYGNHNLEDNLDYLLNYVNNPYFTDENVEKEKDIIIQEINMYKDNPDWIIVAEILKSTFVNHSIRLDIGGEANTVSAITKEDLYNAYNTFYNPHNMGLVIGGNIDCKAIMEHLEKHPTSNMKYDDSKIHRKKYKEPLEVNTKYKEIETNNIAIPKLGMAIKLSTKGMTLKEKYTYSSYINMILFTLFGTSSIFREEMLKQDKFVSFYHNTNQMDDIFTIEFWADTKYPNELVEEIINHLNNDEILESDVERAKKVWISSEVIMTDNVEVTVNNVNSSLIDYSEVKFNRVEDIRNLNLSGLNKARQTININNKAIVIVKPIKIQP